MPRRMIVMTSSNMKSPSSRIRGLYFSKSLNEYGIKSKVYPCNMPDSNVVKKAIFLLKDFIKKIRILFEVSRSSILYIQRGINLLAPFTLLFLLLAKYAFRKKIIYDIDDALFLKYRFSINTILEYSDIVIVSSHALLRYVGRLNKNTWLIPTSVNLARYFAHKPYDSQKSLIIGFVGSSSTNKYMGLLLNPLSHIAKKYDFELRIISAKSKSDYERFEPLYGEFRKKGIRVNQIPWGVNEEYYHLQKIDIGLAPLFNGEWESYKGGYKIINYMAAGVIPIASNIGEHEYIIDDGKNGYLCDNNEDWINSLMEVMGNAARRMRISKQGRKTVKNGYSLDMSAKKLAKIIFGIPQ